MWSCIIRDENIAEIRIKGGWRWLDLIFFSEEYSGHSCRSKTYCAICNSMQHAFEQRNYANSTSTTWLRGGLPLLDRWLKKRFGFIVGKLTGFQLGAILFLFERQFRKIWYTATMETNCLKRQLWCQIGISTSPKVWNMTDFHVKFILHLLVHCPIVQERLIIHWVIYLILFKALLKLLRRANQI